MELKKMFLLHKEAKDQIAYTWLTLNETMKPIIVIRQENVNKVVYVIYNEPPTGLFAYDTLVNQTVRQYLTKRPDFYTNEIKTKITLQLN